MVYRKLIVLLSFLITLNNLHAQTVAADACANAPHICSLTAYTGNTSSSYTPDSPGNFCSGSGCSLFTGSIENNSWLSFTAGAASATFSVNVSNCNAGSNGGIQMGIYSGSNCNNFVLLSDIALTDNGSGGNQAFTITAPFGGAAALVPGGSYYIMVDGYGGDVCDYSITATDGIELPPSISGNSTICPDQSTNIEVIGGSSWQWSSNPAGFTSNLSSVLISPTVTTTYTVTIGGANPYCPSSNVLSSVVTVLPANDPACGLNIACNISALANPADICIGGTSTLSANGSITTVLMANTFNNGAMGVGWSGSSTATLNNPCGMGPDGTTCLWMGDAATAPRNLTSSDFNVVNGGTISFWMRYAVQGDASPCEGPDEIDEGVSLQYSTNTGGTWNDIVYFRPNGTQVATNAWIGASTSDAAGATPFTVWGRYAFNIPPAARTAATRFRWIQLVSTTLVYDHWGLDSIAIVTPPPATDISWTSNPVSFTSPDSITTATPATTTDYIATITATINGTVYSCSQTVTVNINPPLVITIAPVNPTICAGAPITLTANCGVAATTYIWSNSSTLAAISVSPTITTTYTVTGTANGCTGTASIVVNVNPLPTAGISTTLANICEGQSTNLTATGGGSYSWSPSTNLSNANIANPIASPTVTTVYIVTVTVNGCTDTQDITINVDPAISLVVTPSNICLGDNSVISCSGGTSYVWASNPVGFSSSAQNPTVSPIVNTTYSVTATSSTCSATSSAVINVNPLPTPVISGTNSVCINTTGISYSTAATAGNNYSWVITGGVITNQNSNQITVNWGSGTFGTLVVTETSALTGCIGTSPIYNITINPLPIVDFIGLFANYCINDSAVTLTGIPAGGSFLGTGISGNSFTPSNVGVGNHSFTYTYTDLNGCTNDKTYNYIINPLPIVDFTGLNANYCINSPSVALLGTPAGGNFTSLTSGISGTTFNPQVAGIGGPYTLTYSYTDANGCSNSISHVTVIHGLPTLSFVGLDSVICIDAPSITLAGSPWGGTYGGLGVTGNVFDPSLAGVGTHTLTYTYTDNNSCINSLNQTIRVIPKPIVTLANFDTVCINSGIYQLTGGNPLGGIYSGVGVSGGNFNPAIGVGTYQIIYTYSLLGCTSADTNSITVNPLPIVTLAPLPNVCIDVDTIHLTGGLPVGGVYSGQGVNLGYFYPAVAGAGNHYITYSYTDTHGCTDTISQTITVTVFSIPTSDFTINPIDCKGIIDTANYTGTASPFATYQWNFDGGVSFGFNQGPYQVRWDSAGSKTVTLIVHENGCSSLPTSHPVIVSEILPSIFSQSNVKCNGGNDGQAIAIANGGTYPYHFNWSSGQQFATATSLQANYTYFVTVSDANGCVGTTSVVLSEPLPINLTVYGVDISCNGGNDGKAAVVTNGGVLPFTYSWNSSPVPQATDTAINLSANIDYMVITKDSNLCADTAHITLQEPTPLFIYLNRDTTLCPGSSLFLQASAIGGTPNYTYTWNNGLGVGATHSIIANAANAYTVSVTDAKGCIYPPKSFSTSIFPPLNVNIVPEGPLKICKERSISINAIVTGSNGSPYIYTWNNGLGNATPPITVSPLATTTYYLTVTDQCTAPAVDSIIVIVAPLPTVSFNAPDRDGCTPFTTHFKDSSYTNIDFYTWNFGDGGVSNSQNPTHIYDYPGYYDVALTVTDTVGCSSSYTWNSMISVYAHPVADFYYLPLSGTATEPMINFYNTSVDAVSYLWYFGDTARNKHDTLDLVNPSYEYTYPGTYNVWLVATNNFGCKDSVKKKVDILPGYAIYIPNAFSPNGDGINETWAPKGIGIKKALLYIYDRWGEEVYFTDDINKQWDGRANGGNKVAQEDVYIYYILITTDTGEKFKYDGIVTLVR